MINMVYWLAVFVCLGGYNRMAYKQQKFLPHSSGGWEIQDNGSRRSDVWLGTASSFIEGYLLSVSSNREKVPESSLEFLLQGH